MCWATFDLWPDLRHAVCSFCLPSSVSSSSPTSSPLSSLSWSQAKVDNEIIDYRHLAAIPRVKAIYDIEHPDMISYKSVSDDSSALDNKGNRQDRQSPAEVTAFNATSYIWQHVCVSLFWCFRLGLIYASNQARPCFVVLIFECVWPKMQRKMCLWVRFGAVVLLH